MRVVAPLAVAAAVVLLPGVAHADCSVPEVPVVGCVAPGPSATPTPEPTPSASPAPSPTATATAPAAGATGVAGAARIAAPQPVLTGAPVLALPASDLAILVGPVPPDRVIAPAAPVVAPRPVALPAAMPASAVTVAAPVTSPLPGILASSFALVVFGLLALTLLLGFLAGLNPTTPSPGGTLKTTRTRLWTGLGVLGAAALVGGVGWYRISGEPLLNRQIPFLASAGILVVLLSVLGGALIVAEQLRGDQDRIGELEEAVRSLTEALSPLIEQPARRPEAAAVRPRSRGRSLPADAGRT